MGKSFTPFKTMSGKDFDVMAEPDLSGEAVYIFIGLGIASCSLMLTREDAHKVAELIESAVSDSYRAAEKLAEARLDGADMIPRRHGE